MNNIIKRKWNQNSMVIIEDLQGMAFQAESGGHTFQISGIDGEGNTVALSGTPSGVMLRSDGQDVTLTCSVSEGVVSATLPANAYVVPGRFGLTIFLTSDGQKTAIYAAVGTVGKTSSGTVAPPAGSDVVDLVNAIAAAVATIPASYTDLMASVAPTYSSSGLYAVGFYAWYNGKLYRCTTAITSGETWTSGHWTLANLGSDLVDLKSAIKANDLVIWVPGNIASNGGEQSGTQAPDCVKMEYAVSPENIIKVYCETGYYLAIAKYNASGSFVSRTGYDLTEYSFPNDPNYRYRVAVRTANSSANSIELAAANVHFITRENSLKVLQSVEYAGLTPYTGFIFVNDVEQGTISVNGEEQSSSSICRTPYIPVYMFTKLHLYSLESLGVKLVRREYGSDFSLLRNGSAAYTFDISVPSDTYYMRFLIVPDSGSLTPSSVKSLGIQITTDIKKRNFDNEFYIPIVGYGRVSNGSSGVTKVGDRFIDNQTYALNVCTKYTSATNMECARIAYDDDTLFMYNRSFWHFISHEFVPAFATTVITGIGTQGGGTSGVRQVGDIYFNTIDHKLHKCTSYTSALVFDDISYYASYSEIYILKDDLYYYANNDLHLMSQKQVIQIVGVGSEGLGTSGVRKNGDVYWNINDKKLYECIAYRTPMDFTEVKFDPVVGVIYLCNGVFYCYDGKNIIKNGNAIDNLNIIKGLYVEDTTEDQRFSAMMNGIIFADELNDHLVDYAKETDLMVHTSTMRIVDGVVYSTVLVNETSTAENPSELFIRFQHSPLNDLENITYHTISQVGDTFDGQNITKIFDSVCYYFNNLIYIIWNAYLETDDCYYLLYKTYNPLTGTFSDTGVCTFTVGEDTDEFSQKNINTLLEENDLFMYPAWNQLAFNPAISSRVEGNDTYYYTAIGCDRLFNCIIKTKDFVNWIFVSQPPFEAYAQYETTAYVMDNYVYYYCRQMFDCKYSFLTRYSITNDTWENPCFVLDAQSRPMFFAQGNDLYLIYAHSDRNHITIMRINRQYLNRSNIVQDALVPDYFYPCTEKYNNELYMMFTNTRKHIYLAKYHISTTSAYDWMTALKNLFQI